MPIFTEKEREMNMDIYSSSTLIAPILLFALSISFFWWIWRSSPNLPPGPRGLPILGYLPFLRDDVHNQFIELADKYGPIYKLWLGNKLCVVINSASLIKQVLRDHDTVFSNRDLSVAACIATLNNNDIVSCPCGPKWRDRKKLVVHDLLSNSSLDKSYNLRKDELRKTISHVYRSRAGTTVDVTELIHMISMNMTTRMAWGSTIQGEARDEIAAEFLPWLTTYLELLGKPNISDYFPILSIFDFQKVGEKMRIHTRWAETIIGEINDEATKRKRSFDYDVKIEEGWIDVITMIVDLKEKDYQKISLTKTEIIAMFLNMIASSRDSSTAINWAMAELLKNPGMMEKVQRELDEVVGLNSIVEESHVSRFVYLDAVIKESLRLHPSAPFLIPRSSSQPCTVGGYSIPNDTVIFPNILSAQKDPLVFDNPYEFRPERFVDNSIITTRKWDFMGNNFNFLPFGSGRRRCPGIPLAERMVPYVLASLLHSFDWQLPCGEELDMLDACEFNTLTKRTPLCAIPVPRLFDSDLYV